MTAHPFIVIMDNLSVQHVLEVIVHFRQATLFWMWLHESIAGPVLLSLTRLKSNKWCTACQQVCLWYQLEVL